MLHRPIDAKIMPPRVFALGDGVRLAIWDQSGLRGSRLAPRVDGVAIAPPVARLTVPTRWKAERCLVAFRRPASEEQEQQFELTDDQDRVLARTMVSGSDGGAGVDVGALVTGLGVDGRVRIARFLLDVCRASFRLANDTEFAAMVARLLGEIVAEPGTLRPRVKLPGGAIACVTGVPAALGRIAVAAVVGARRILDLPVAPSVDHASSRDGQSPAWLVLGNAEARSGTLVLVGEGGLVCRKLGASTGALPDPLDWLGANPKRTERDLVCRYLAARAAAGDERAAALSREIALFAPEPAVSITDPAKPVGAEIEAAIEDGSGHVFLSGWVRDPLQLVDALEIAGAPVNAHWISRPDKALRLGMQNASDARALSGFVARVPSIDAMTAEFALKLKSGGRIRLRPRGRSWSPAEARDAVLASVPADTVTQAMLEDAIAPAAVALQAMHLATRRPPAVIDLGQRTVAPAATVIVPLYRNLSFLPFQFAAFAVDPAFADVEVVYVLDSPEQRAEVETQLRHLVAIYGLPVRLVVMSGNFGYAAANNAGASVAAGQAIVLLNSDVVPEGSGWLAPLLARLGDDSVGAVGARLLFDDGSLQHAGLYYAADDRGEWRNRHYFKGFPRDFAAAAVSRTVPAVTGACLAIRRPAYEALNGLDEGYVIGDYEDSDLCLRLRSRGLEIAYEPEATLIHFERQSVPMHVAHAQGLASECNRWLHASRWQPLMEDQMRNQAKVARELAPVTAHPARNRRRLRRAA